MTLGREDERHIAVLDHHRHRSPDKATLPMSRVKKESHDDSGASFVVRQSSTPEPHSRGLVTTPSHDELSSRLRKLNDRFDELTSESFAAREKVKAAEREVDEKRRALVDLGQEIRVIQDRLSNKASSSSAEELTAEVVPIRDASASRSHRGDFGNDHVKFKQKKSAIPDGERSHEAENHERTEEGKTPNQKGGASSRRGDVINSTVSTRSQSAVQQAGPHQKHMPPSTSRHYQGQASGAIALPFSHRPCEISSTPPISVDTLPFISFVRLLQDKMRTHPHKLLSRGDVGRLAQIVDPHVQTRFQLKKLEDFLPLAQQYLNLVLEGQLRGSSVHFGDVDRPWLRQPHQSVPPDIKAQLQELAIWERSKLPQWGPDIFFPLVQILSTSGARRGQPFSSLISLLQSRGQRLTEGTTSVGCSSQASLSLGEFLDVASVWCNIDIIQDANAQSRARLTDSQAPFKRREHNDRFFRYLQTIPQANRKDKPQSKAGAAAQGAPLGTKRKAEGDGGKQASKKKKARSIVAPS